MILKGKKLIFCNLDRGDERWAKNKSYFWLDGKTTVLNREKMVNKFNSSSKVLPFLMSTKVGVWGWIWLVTIASSSLTRRGIQITTPRLPAESRGTKLECIGSQTVNSLFYLISRYRQKKPCYVYRLVMDNTMERNIYDRQISKQV